MGAPSHRGRERPLGDDRGVVLVLVAASMVAILGIAALVMDLGNARQESRHAQATSDAAALAAAQDLPDQTEPDPDVSREAAELAMTYAFENALGQPFSGTLAGDGPWTETLGAVTVTVETPYTLAGSTIPANFLVYVEVCTDTASFFAGALGDSSPTVCRDAVARKIELPSDTGIGVLALEPVECEAGELTGTGDVVVNNGAFIVNSDCEPDALDFRGSSSLVAELVGVVGGWDCNGQCDQASTEPQGVGVQPDPYEGLDYPDRPARSPDSGSCNKLDGVMEPGRYDSKCVVNDSSVRLRPGLYWIEDELRFNGNAVLTCEDDPDGGPTCAQDGVLFFVADTPKATIDMNGGAGSSLPAPSTGEWAGVSIFQHRDNDNESKVNGGFGGDWGAVYAKTGTITVGGNSATVISGPLVAGYLSFAGTGGVTVNVPPDAPVLTGAADLGLEE